MLGRSREPALIPELPIHEVVASGARYGTASHRAVGYRAGAIERYQAERGVAPRWSWWCWRAWACPRRWLLLLVGLRLLDIEPTARAGKFMPLCWLAPAHETGGRDQAAICRSISPWGIRSRACR